MKKVVRFLTHKTKVALFFASLLAAALVVQSCGSSSGMFAHKACQAQKPNNHR